PWGEIVGQVYLGGEAFRKGLEKRARARRPSREIPRAQTRPGRPGLALVLAAVARVYQTTEEAIRHGRGGPARTLVALLGRTEGALKRREIAEALAIGIARVSRLAVQGEEQRARDPEFCAQARRALRLLTGESKD